MEIDLGYARQVLEMEAEAIRSLLPRLGDDFAAAARRILDCRGRVVVTGMGKAGLIGQKVSATLASTGTPSLFLHPAEAVHGDLGRVVPEDVVLALSNSGGTEEVLRLLPFLAEIGVPLIAVTASRESPLGAHSEICLEIGPIAEACPLGLAPSASTTALLAMGDALALTVLRARRFGPREYARYHPAGALGRSLLTVREVMRHGARCPTVRADMPVRSVLEAITRARAGAAVVEDAEGLLAGIFTDGDLRRRLEEPGNLLDRPVGEVMTPTPLTICEDRPAIEGVRLLRDRKVDELPVVDAQGRPVGMLDVQDLLDLEGWATAPPGRKDAR